MASLLNSRWQHSKERPNRSTNNGDMVYGPKRYVVCEWESKWACEWQPSKKETKLLKMNKVIMLERRTDIPCKSRHCKQSSKRILKKEIWKTCDWYCVLWYFIYLLTINFTSNLKLWRFIIINEIITPLVNIIFLKIHF